MVIFSKNRACQLDQLLRSLSEHLEERHLFAITVLYVADDAEFSDAYKIVEHQFKFVAFIEQRTDQTIGQQIHNIIVDSRKEFFCMLVDDDILIRKLSLHSPQFDTFRQNVGISSLSIRLSPSITYCQPLLIAERPPRINSDGVFHWYATPFWRLVRDVSVLLGQTGLGVGDWAVSMSMDGNFFRLAEFREYFRRLPEIRDFGDIEGAMVHVPIPKEYGICFAEAKLINVPLNSVRTDYSYPNMAIDATYLNSLFMSGARLDYRHLCSINSFSCHVEVAPRWIESHEANC